MYKFFTILFLSFYSLTIIISSSLAEENKIKIGLLVPLSGNNAEIGKQIIKATRLALKDINSNKIEIFPKDTYSNPKKTLSSAIELSNQGINLVIGPVFYENLIYLNEVKNLTFLSFTNKTLGLPKNVISTGIILSNNTIKNSLNKMKLKNYILIPNLNYDLEIKNGIKQSKIKF